MGSPGPLWRNSPEAFQPLAATAGDAAVSKVNAGVGFCAAKDRGILSGARGAFAQTQLGTH